MTSKKITSEQALNTIKNYLLKKLKEDNSELGSLIIKENVKVIEESLEQAQKQEKLLNKIKEIIDRPGDSIITSISTYYSIYSNRYYEIEKLIKELEK